MLSAQEIKKLEEIWKKNKIKKYFKYFSILFVILLIILLIFIYFGGNDFKVLTNYFEKNNSLPLAKKQIKKVYVVKTKKIINTTLIKPVIAPKQNIDKNTTANKIKYVKKIKNSNNSDLLVLNTNFLTKVYSRDENNSNKNKKISSVQPDKKIIKKIRVGNKVIKKKKAPKQKIFISSKKIDKLAYLKDRFNSSKKAIYATMLSEIYFDKHDYKKSLAWAITSNNINSSNEDSWVLFAKNKVKLGMKKDAINALSAYLKIYNSKKIKNLLMKIKRGYFK